MKLALSLLGEIEVSLDNNVVKDLCAEKTQALLFYLIVESGRAHRREYLAEMFWPEKPPGFARNNLKQALSQLKKALGDQDSDTPYLISSKRDLQFNADSPHWIDVLELERKIKRTKTHEHENLAECEICMEFLHKGTELYRDDFLSDFYLPDSPEFNEWTLTKREYYRRLIVDSLNKLIIYHETQCDYKKAASYAISLVEMEPWNESNQRKLMALLAASGKRSAALKQYQICKSMLASEFDVQPTPETTALYERIKAWDVSKDSPIKGGSIPIDHEQPIPVPESVESPEKSLRSWIKASALVSFLALAAILYLVFFKDGLPLTRPEAPGVESEQTSSGSGGDSVEKDIDLNDNSGGQTSRSYLDDPNQICLEGEELLYVEDFQDGKGQGWPEIEFRAQNWDVVQDPKDPENLVVQNPGKHSAMVLYREVFPSDAVFRINFFPTDNPQPTFLWHSNNKPYEDERGVVTSSDYSIGFMDYGTHFTRYTHPLQEANLQFGDFWLRNDTWHLLEISTYEGLLRVWLDGEELLAYQDPNPLPPGTIGIGLAGSLEAGSMVYYDNLSVCELNEPFESIFSK